jgi:hypothetical protein
MDWSVRYSIATKAKTEADKGGPNINGTISSYSLTYGVLMEPPVGFEPTTFRLRIGERHLASVCFSLGDVVNTGFPRITEVGLRSEVG